MAGATVSGLLVQSVMAFDATKFPSSLLLQARAVGSNTLTAVGGMLYCKIHRDADRIHAVQAL